MKTNICKLTLCCLACVATYDAYAAAADLILLSDHVLTMSGTRDQQGEPLAIAIKGDEIIWVGQQDAAEQYQSKATQIVELGEQAVLPGFIDAHGHVAFVGLASALANVASPPVGPVQTIADLQATLRAYIAENNIAEGTWVVGRGYDDSLINEQRHPDRDDLDAVSSDHPIVLQHVSGHLATANSKALARAGINAESEDPAGGVIRRRPNSREPNGVLEETAAYPLRPFMYSPGTDPVQSVVDALALYAQNGITTAQDGASSPDTVKLMRTADAQGRLYLDVVLYPMGQAGLDALPADLAYGEYTGRVKVGGVKLMLDGSPQGKTAYMTKPYLVPPEGQSVSYRGYPNIPQPQVDSLVKAYLANSIQIIAHANGDAAADMLINAVADASPRTDHRTVMIHAQTVREDQLTAMKRWRMIPSFFAAHSFYWGDWHRDSVFGVARAERISPTSSTLARGMPFTVHNDAPVVPPDMLRLLWATTNRLTRSGKVLGAAQRISTFQALRAVTVNAAYQNFEEHRKGTLEAGKLADLVVLSTDPTSVPSTELLNIAIERTYSHGELVYARNTAGE
jgi:predicted amidohydrolase YtcJ